LNHAWANKRTQLIAKQSLIEVPTGMLGQPKFNGGGKFLRLLVAVLMHVPTFLYEPILEHIQRNLIPKIPTELCTNLRFSDHFYDLSAVGAEL